MMTNSSKKEDDDKSPTNVETQFTLEIPSLNVASQNQ